MSKTARFKPLAEIMGEGGTNWNQGGTKQNHPKPLIIKVEPMEPLEPSKNQRLQAKPGGVDVATSDSFRAKLLQASSGTGAGLAALVAEFQQDAEEIAAGLFTDETLKTAILAFMQQAGIHPQPGTTTPEEDGMIKCRQCGHWWQRCRHPTLHGGGWISLDAERWRRCVGYARRG